MAIGCGTVGSLASPTPAPTNLQEASATPSITDSAKSEVSAIFVGQFEAVRNGDWQAVFDSCSPSYRSRRDASRLAEDIERYLTRLDTTFEELDVRNPVADKSREDRFDLDYDLYIDGEFSETVRVGGAYVQVHGEWYDDGVWCR